MKTVEWGERQVDVLEFHHLVDWANDTERYRDLPPLGQLPREQASFEKRPILRDLTLEEQAYIRAHWERRHMFHATMERMAWGIWESDQVHYGDNGEIIMAERQTNGPDYADPELMQRLNEYRTSGRFEQDYRLRLRNLTRTWAGPEHEPYLFAPVQPYIYARAGALAIRSVFQAQQFTGRAVRQLMTRGGLGPHDTNAIQKLFVAHGIIEYCVTEDSFGPVRPDPGISPMQINPELIGHLESQTFYDIPLQAVPK